MALSIIIIVMFFVVILLKVYLPLLCTDGLLTYGGVSADKLMDILHRMMGNVEVTEGNVEVNIAKPLVDLWTSR